MIHVETLGPPHQVLPGIAFPATVLVVAEEEPGHPCDVTVRVEAEAGRMVPAEVTVRRRPGGPPVTGEMLRSVQVAALVKHAAVATYVSERPAGDRLQQVAHMYRLAAFIGQAPTVTVADQLGMSRATAGRLISAARKAGLLA